MKKKHQWRWYVPEESLLDMLVQSMNTLNWVESLHRRGIVIHHKYLFDPAKLILDMLDVPHDLDSKLRGELESRVYFFNGTTIEEMRSLFAEVINRAHQ